MISGQLVGLRSVEREDLSLLRDWRNIPEFRRCFREHRELNMENQERWFSRMSGNPNDFMFVIQDLSTGTPIGACGLLYTNWIIRAADFSFYIGSEARYIDSGGLAHEAARLLIDYGFRDLNLNKLWMELYEFDTKKIQFFSEDFGFTTDGTLPENCFCDGRYWDSLMLSLLANDYRRTSSGAGDA